MTPTEMEAEIRAISARLKALSEAVPEMTGMDWAADHGWVSHDEWEDAEQRSKAGSKQQDAEVEKIEALRRQHPEAMEKFLAAFLERLHRLVTELTEKKKRSPEEFPQNFNLLLLPDVIGTLTHWKEKKEPKHWPAWAWRVVFPVEEEVKRFLAAS